MDNKWTDLKAGISQHVNILKANLENIYKAEYAANTVYVTAKFKDNLKDALITIVHNKLSKPDMTLGVGLANSQNLKMKFEKLLNDFNERVKTL